MEHRWGQRLAIDLAIRVAARPYNVRAARLVDLSASGAYIKVSADLRLLSRVQIALALPHRLTHPTPMVAAYVARKGKDGVGLEWCEYAPKSVLELLRYAAGHRHDRHHAAELGRYVPATNPLPADPWDEPKSFAEA
jgi:hypothetical protein